MNSSFANIKAIAKREMSGYSSPVAYVFIVIFCWAGFFVHGRLFLRTRTGAIGIPSSFSLVYLFLVGIGMTGGGKRPALTTLLPCPSCGKIVGKN
jgi:hypothetical protein